MEIHKLDGHRMCIECFKENPNCFMREGIYAIVFPQISKPRKVHLCYKHLRQLLVKIDKVLETKLFEDR